MTEPALPTFEAFVDGAPVSISGMWYHYQTDPYPGGKRYRLVLNDREWAGQFSRIGFAATDGKPNEKDQNDILQLFNIAVSFVFLRQGKKTQYENGISHVANDVSRLLVTEDQVVLEGTCSDFIGRSGTRPSDA